MTEKQVQQIVAEAIAEACPQSEKYYHVCWWEGKLQCLHVRHTEEMHRVFYAAPGQAFVDGLSSHQWRLVATRVMEFCRSRGITAHRGSARRKGRSSSKSPKERLQITAFDSMRLGALLASVRSPESTMNACLDELQHLLETADTVAPEKVADDVVTMNSRVRLEDDREENAMTLSLVFPTEAINDAELDKMKVSILTPIGLSLLGRRVGDTVEGRVKIQELMYQPEAAGDFDM